MSPRVTRLTHPRHISIGSNQCGGGVAYRPDHAAIPPGCNLLRPTVFLSRVAAVSRGQ